MRSIETRAVVRAGGTLTVTTQAPSDLPPGEHHAVLVIDEAPLTETDAAARPKRQAPLSPALDFPVDDCGPWPTNLSLRREDLYDDRVR